MEYNNISQNLQRIDYSVQELFQFTNEVKSYISIRMSFINE